MRILGKGKKKRAGFTLIELMVVVIVVGILAAAAIPIYRFAMSRAYSSEAKATIGTILSSMKVFYAENNNDYPTYVWGVSNEGDKSSDIMAILGVDTATNNWWHAGWEGTNDTVNALAAGMCSFGTSETTWPVAETDIAAPTPLPTGPYVWAKGDVADQPISGIGVVYAIGGDEWVTKF